MRTRWMLTLVMLLAASAAHATSGYFSHGYGTRAKGMGGAGSALALEPMASASNPAALAFLPSGTQVAVAVFHPDREYEVTGDPSGAPGTFGLAPGLVRSGSRWFVVPTVALRRELRGGYAGGLALFGNGGMNTDYRSPTFGATPTGVDLAQGFATATLARAFGRHAVGVSPVLGVQRFRAQGLGAFAPFSQDPGALTDNGYAVALGGGVRLGYLGRPITGVAVAASYQSRLWMSPLEDYRGLFAENGDFDVPDQWTLGVGLTPRPGLDLAMDVQQVHYSDVHSIMHPMFPNLGQTALGAWEGAGFGWRDVTTYKFGLRATPPGDWSWSAGYAYGRQPIPSDEVLFNILAPGVIEHHATLGVTRRLAGGREIDAALMHGFSHTVRGANTLEAPGAQDIELRMHQWELEVGIRF